MQFGKPVILSNKSALPEVGGPHAYYWEHFEPKYMAELVIKSLDNFQSNQLLKSEAIKTYAQSFSWSKTAKEYIQVYKSLLLK